MASSFDLSFTANVTVRPLGPFSVTLPFSLSTASTVPRTFVAEPSALPGSVSVLAGAGAFSVVGAWAHAVAMVTKSTPPAITAAATTLLLVSCGLDGGRSRPSVEDRQSRRYGIKIPGTSRVPFVGAGTGPAGRASLAAPAHSPTSEAHVPSSFGGLTPPDLQRPPAA